MKKLLFILLLTGCGNSEFVHGDWTGNICVTPDFNDDQNVLIYQATQEWKERSYANVNLQVSFLNNFGNYDEDDCDGIVFYKTPPNGMIGSTGIPTSTGEPIYIYLNPILNTLNQDQINNFYSVTLHEFGHYLGAEHSPYCNDIMYWKLNGVYHLSDNDVNQLWHPYPIDKYNDLTYCL